MLTPETYVGDMLLANGIHRGDSSYLSWVSGLKKESHFFFPLKVMDKVGKTDYPTFSLVLI